MADFDLDAARAARQQARKEADREPFIFTFGGEEFTFPVRPPWGFMEAMFSVGNRLQLTFLAVRALLGEQYERFVGHRPEIEDVGELVDKAIELYGFGDAGESQASGGSSSRSGSRSRRTSSGSTGSTSRKKSGEAKGSTSVD